MTTRSRMWGVRNGKKIRMPRAYGTPRQNANAFRAWSSGQYNAKAANRSWKPKKRRRKLGARRKATLIQSVWRWVKTGSVRRKRMR
jgi:hypothetical protein